jgi:hypothetical protein
VDDFDELMNAIKGGEAVVIDVPIASASAHLRTARDNARRAWEARDRGEFVASIGGGQSEGRFVCGVPR